MDLVSRNVSGVNQAGYSKKTANLTVGPTGTVRMTGVTRSADQVLFTSYINTTSSAATQSALLAGVTQLQQTVDSALGEATPAGRIGSLVDALQQAAAAPGNQSLAANAVTTAKDLVQTLNDSTTAVQTVRQNADADIATSVSNLNTMLAKFGEMNTRIMQDSAAGRDVTDQLDARDQLLGQMSQEIGIRTTTRGNGDMQIYTDGGATLFDTSARTVSFQPTLQYSATTQGNAVVVDGTPVTGPGAVMTAQSGRIAGLTQLRDQVAVQYQGQLDELARGVINAFAEMDTTGSAASARAGLFRAGTSTALPGANLVPGLAGQITVATTVDPTQGGNPMLLRDGGISDPLDPNYNINTTGAASFTDRLQSMLSSIETPQSFSASGGAITSGSIAGYAASSVGWIEGKVQVITNSSDQQNAVLTRASAALSSATGVSLDNEMSKMLDLERSYQGSAKLVTAIDSMLQSLLQAV